MSGPRTDTRRTLPGARDRLALSGLTVDCVVGVYPRERVTPQPLHVDLELAIDAETAGREERFAETVDYALLAEEVAFVLRTARFTLIETAALVLARLLLLAPHPSERRAPVAWAAVTLSKPRALSGGALPSLRVERDAAWAQAAPGADGAADGAATRLHDGRDARVDRLVLAPGAALATRAEAAGRAAHHFVRGGVVTADGAAFGPGPLPPAVVGHLTAEPPHPAALLRVEAPTPAPGRRRGRDGSRAPG